ncbi:MAG TPA: hypothetical protein VES66_07425 [Terriglobales bacterium]|nr:hypothetical protein [Terriglobales bacterium]
MKRIASCLALLLVSSCTLLAAPDTPASHFDQLKRLAGTWEGKTADGKPVSISLQVVSDGSAVMQLDQGENMVTMYHPDNGRLLMTHYCSAHNQPRMQAEVSPDGKRFTFNFLDATNLATPDAGHMQRMVLTIEDANHMTQQWFFLAGTKEQTETFKFTRKP